MMPDKWQERDSLRTTFFTDRGFTLHVSECSKRASTAQRVWQAAAIPMSTNEIGKHYDKLQIINMNARMYDPILGEFTSVDPLADKYPGWGPYVYCVNNPLSKIDPTGENEYNFDDKGEIMLAIEKDGPDELYKIGDDGKRTGECESFEDGTFDNEVEVVGIPNPPPGTALANNDKGEGYEIKDKAEAEKLFKFMSDNTKVEFGIIETKNAGSLVMTNHNTLGVAVGQTAQKIYGSNFADVERISHYHPPTGRQGPQNNDLTNAGKINAKNPNVVFSIYSRSLGYIPYNDLGVLNTSGATIFGNK